MASLQHRTRLLRRMLTHPTPHQSLSATASPKGEALDSAARRLARSLPSPAGEGAGLVPADEVLPHLCGGRQPPPYGLCEFLQTGRGRRPDDPFALCMTPHPSTPLTPSPTGEGLDRLRTRAAGDRRRMTICTHLLRTPTGGGVQRTNQAFPLGGRWCVSTG